MNTRTVALALALLMVMGCGASRAGVSTSAGPAHIAASELIARVKTALLNDEVVGKRRIDVHATGNDINLTGRVASAAERDRALQIARGVAGVRSATSSLEIRP